MKRITACISILYLSAVVASSQSLEMRDSVDLNLDFEQHVNGFPFQWEEYGNDGYKIYLDSTNAYSGDYSVVIESDGKNTQFKALAINLPYNYIGTTITLTGYIKTENVSDGFAGLWMRIDPEIAFDNMQSEGLMGTRDWEKYEIKLRLNPGETDKIVIGGLLVGKGKIWLDKFNVTIDGLELNDSSLPIYNRELLPAEKDTQFDNGSLIKFPELDSSFQNNLVLLGRIWGFLKYHHPEVGNGNYNWDYELFRILPDYISASGSGERDIILELWIAKYGNVDSCISCKTSSKSAKLKPDLSWIDQSNLSQRLKNQLKTIYRNRDQGEHYYISLEPQVGNPKFQNEDSYESMSYPDEGYRLLSLYRLWNMIEYFCPNKHLTNKDWEVVLEEYIPIFLNATNELEYELAALQLIGEINDTHANLWGGKDKINELRGDNYAPFKTEFVENKLVVTDYYSTEYSKEGQLKSGDIITHINNQPVMSIVDSLRPYYPASNESAFLRDVSMDLIRSDQTSINLTCISHGETRLLNVNLLQRDQLNLYYYLYKVNSGEPSFKILNGNIGYISLANIQNDDIPKIKDQLKNTKGIIIDIRNYPSTFVPFTLGSFFVKDPTPFVKFTNGNPDNPGEFIYRDGAKIPGARKPYKGKLVVLVNDVTQSQAE